jgi:hypothetical protein
MNPLRADSANEYQPLPLAVLVLEDSMSYDHWLGMPDLMDQELSSPRPVTRSGSARITDLLSLNHDEND